MTEPDEDIEEIKRQIIFARRMLKEIQQDMVNSGASYSIGVDVEFPDPDVAHVWRTLFGKRLMSNEPIVYRLSFGNPLKWIGVSHPWGMKPADIICQDDQEGL